MSNGWLDGMGTVTGILLGIAIPAQEAMRAHKAIGVLLAERIQATTDAFDAAQALAQQAVCALCGPVPERTHFATTYNRSYIEHVLKRVETTANEAISTAPKSATAFVNAVSRARVSTRDFFDDLSTANLAKSTPQALHGLSDRLTRDLHELHIASDRALKTRHVGMSAIGAICARWNAR
jgi:enoyl-CoA hydratase/carnithine racemase